MLALRRVVAGAVSVGTLALALVSAPARAEVVVILNSGDASVTLIDKDTQKVLETFPIGKEPHHLIATPDDKSLIVANAVGNDLVFLDPVTGKVQQRVPNIDDPYQIGFSPDQKWFIATGNRLDRLPPRLHHALSGSRGRSHPSRSSPHDQQPRLRPPSRRVRSHPVE